MRRRRIALLLLLFAAEVTAFSLLSPATAAEVESLDAGKGTTAEQKSLLSSSSSASSLPSSSSSSSSASTDSSSLPTASMMPSPLRRPSRRRKLLCDVSTVSTAQDASLGFGDNSNLTPYVFEKAGKSTNNGTTATTKSAAAAGVGAFKSLNASVANHSRAGAISDMCSQAPPVVDASVSDPLDSREVFHARVWSDDEIVATALRRRGRAVRALTEFDLAAASPMLLPSLVRYRPLSDAAHGNEVARVMDAFADGTIPASGPGSDPNGLPSVVRDLEAAAATAFSGRGGKRQTISAAGIRRMLAHPELVLLAMASDRTGAERITKEQYRKFLVRDSAVDVCDDRAVVVVNGDLGAPVDRLFARADKDGDGTLDAAEIKMANLTDAATVWMLAGDTNGDMMLTAEELASGLPQCVFDFFRSFFYILFFSFALSFHLAISHFFFKE